MPNNNSSGGETMFPEAEQFAEELYRYSLASQSEEMARKLADDWLNSFNQMYATSHEDPAAIEDFDERLRILRLKVPFAEKLAAWCSRFPLPTKPK